MLTVVMMLKSHMQPIKWAYDPYASKGGKSSNFV